MNSECMWNRCKFVGTKIKFLDSESQNCKFVAHSGLKSDTMAMYLARANGSVVASSLLSPFSCPTYSCSLLGRSPYGDGLPQTF